MVSFFGAIFNPKNARIPAKGIANNGTREKVIPKVLENRDIKPLPEKSPILTKKVSNITEDL